MPNTSSFSFLGLHKAFFFHTSESYWYLHSPFLPPNYSSTGYASNSFWWVAADVLKRIPVWSWSNSSREIALWQIINHPLISLTYAFTRALFSLPSVPSKLSFPCIVALEWLNLWFQPKLTWRKEYIFRHRSATDFSSLTTFLLHILKTSITKIAPLTYFSLSKYALGAVTGSEK